MKRKSFIAIIAFLAVAFIAACSGETPVDRIVLSDTVLSMEVGDSVTVTANVEPDDADYDELTWSSANTSIATVNNGTITAVAAGQTSITVAAGGEYAYVAVTVSAPADPDPNPDPDPDPEPVVAEEVEHDVTGIEVAYGTSEADALALLPGSVVVVDSEGESHTMSLTWSVSGYDAETAGDYTATGIFSLPANVEQGDISLEVSAVITVLSDDTAYLDSIGSVSGFTVALGSTWSYVQDLLPTTVELTDNFGETYEVTVSWHEGDFDGEESGSYTIVGTFELPEGLYNDGHDLEVTATVTVDEYRPAVSSYKMSFEGYKLLLGSDEPFTINISADTVGVAGLEGAKLVFTSNASNDTGDIYFTYNGETFINHGVISLDLAKDADMALELMLDITANDDYEIHFELQDADGNRVQQVSAIAWETQVTSPRNAQIHFEGTTNNIRINWQDVVSVSNTMYRRVGSFDLPTNEYTFTLPEGVELISFDGETVTFEYMGAKAGRGATAGLVDKYEFSTIATPVTIEDTLPIVDGKYQVDWDTDNLTHLLDKLEYMSLSLYDGDTLLASNTSNALRASNGSIINVASVVSNEFDPFNDRVWEVSDVLAQPDTIVLTYKVTGLAEQTVTVEVDKLQSYEISIIDPANVADLAANSRGVVGVVAYVNEGLIYLQDYRSNNNTTIVLELDADHGLKVEDHVIIVLGEEPSVAYKYKDTVKLTVESKGSVDAVLSEYQYGQNPGRYTLTDVEVLYQDGEVFLVSEAYGIHLRFDAEYLTKPYPSNLGSGVSVDKEEFFKLVHPEMIDEVTFTVSHTFDYSAGYLNVMDVELKEITPADHFGAMLDAELEAEIKALMDWFEEQVEDQSSSLENGVISFDSSFLPTTISLPATNQTRNVTWHSNNAAFDLVYRELTLPALGSNAINNVQLSARLAGTTTNRVSTTFTIPNLQSYILNFIDERIEEAIEQHGGLELKDGIITVDRDAVNEDGQIRLPINHSINVYGVEYYITHLLPTSSNSIIRFVQPEGSDDFEMVITPATNTNNVSASMNIQTRFETAQRLQADIDNENVEPGDERPHWALTSNTTLRSLRVNSFHYEAMESLEEQVDTYFDALTKTDGRFVIRENGDLASLVFDAIVEGNEKYEIVWTLPTGVTYSEEDGFQVSVQANSDRTGNIRATLRYNDSFNVGSYDVPIRVLSVWNQFIEQTDGNLPENLVVGAQDNDITFVESIVVNGVTYNAYWQTSQTGNWRDEDNRLPTHADYEGVDPEATYTIYPDGSFTRPLENNATVSISVNLRVDETTSNITGSQTYSFSVLSELNLVKGAIEDAIESSYYKSDEAVTLTPDFSVTPALEKFAGTPNITWSSSNANIVSVEGNTLTFHETGTVTITANFRNLDGKAYSFAKSINVVADPAEPFYTVSSDLNASANFIPATTGTGFGNYRVVFGSVSNGTLGLNWDAAQPHQTGYVRALFPLNNMDKVTFDLTGSALIDTDELNGFYLNVKFLNASGAVVSQETISLNADNYADDFDWSFEYTNKGIAYMHFELVKPGDVTSVENNETIVNYDSFELSVENLTVWAEQPVVQSPSSQGTIVHEFDRNDNDGRGELLEANDLPEYITISDQFGNNFQVQVNWSSFAPDQTANLVHGTTYEIRGSIVTEDGMIVLRNGNLIDPLQLSFPAGFTNRVTIYVTAEGYRTATNVTLDNEYVFAHEGDSLNTVLENILEENKVNVFSGNFKLSKDLDALSLNWIVPGYDGKPGMYTAYAIIPANALASEGMRHGAVELQVKVEVVAAVPAPVESEMKLSEKELFNEGKLDLVVEYFNDANNDVEFTGNAFEYRIINVRTGEVVTDTAVTVNRVAIPGQTITIHIFDNTLADDTYRLEVKLTDEAGNVFRETRIVTVYDPEPTSIDVEGPNSIDIDDETVTTTYSGIVLDQEEFDLEYDVTWTLKEAVTGASISSEGVLTLTRATLESDSLILVASGAGITKDVTVSLELPEIDEITVTGTAIVLIPGLADSHKNVGDYESTFKDQFGNPISGTAVWSLDGDYDGVTIDTGILTVTSEAAVGTIGVVATANNVSETLNVSLELADPQPTTGTVTGTAIITVPGASVEGGTSVDYTVSVLDQYGEDYVATSTAWSISGSAIDGVSITTGGTLTVDYRAEDQTITIIANVDGEEYTLPVELKRADSVFTYIEVNGLKSVTKPSENPTTTSYTAILLDQYKESSNITQSAVTWSIVSTETDGITIASDSGILTVPTGVSIKAITIRASYDNVSEDYEIQLLDAVPESAVITGPAVYTVPTSGSITLQYNVEVTDNENQIMDSEDFDVSWDILALQSTSNPLVTVDANGLVTVKHDFDNDFTVEATIVVPNADDIVISYQVTTGNQ